MSELPGPASAGPLILLVDDDRLVLMTLSQQLQAAGYQIIEADNGDDAILLARQFRPRLALLDMRMAGKSGLDVAMYLRDYVGTPFVFLSAFADDALVSQAMAIGAIDYLVKPIDQSRILPALARAIDETRDTWEREPNWRPRRPVTTSGYEANRLIAIGIVMARCELDREAASSWIAIKAVEEALTEEECVHRILDGAAFFQRTGQR